MPNEPLSGPIEAVIFDMDGLLIDSEAIYLRAMQTAARAVGRDMSLEFCHSMVGVPGHECNLMIQELYGADFDLKEFRVHVSAHVRQSMDERVPIKPGVVEKWDLYINGVESGTGYSELIDPVIQRERLEEQARLAAAGDPEAMDVDEDFLRALEFGMPPAGGMGLGVDRLVMLLTNCQTIRDVILFPLLRPEAGLEARGTSNPSQ